MNVKLAILIVVMSAIGFALIGATLVYLWQDAKTMCGSRRGANSSRTLD